ncbi:hypothetical protein O6H91_20G070200 [Diphasiastrum complanatum]|uniref:Uncharacterized protein n=1 Tax=Diphasiastrum complanatum TaxID=34168 RepID=A0ACC2ARL8_DIPCM|nr:hypothetical protein O6H91_20G070200 [Diphasiastrum complanatum]
MRSWSSRALEIVAASSSLNSEILSHITALKSSYVSFPLLSNGHVESIFARLFRSLPAVEFRRECLGMADGGTVALDWPIGGAGGDMWNTKLSEDAPALILLPGLTGGSGDTYVRHFLVRARQHGWNATVFNSRGCAASPVTSPQFYSASFTEDLREVVKHVSNCFPRSPVYAVGWSLGANILVRYLGEESEKCTLTGAVSLCNPYDLVIADKNFQKGFNKVYDKRLAKSLRNSLKKHAALFEGIGGAYDVQKAIQAKSIREYDDGLTKVSFGYKTVDDYYFDSSSSRSVKDVKVPLLCIQAETDPIAPSCAIPRAEILKNPHCLLVITPTGGHLGWVAGNDGPFGSPWTDSVVMDYLQYIELLRKNKSTALCN